MIVGEPTRRSATRFGQSEFDPESEAYSKELTGFIEKNGLQNKVILPGFQDDLTGYLGAMDIFVFPSRNELYALAVLDAMCMRLPIIATRAGGNLEQIRENETGLFYEAGDSMDLAAKLSLYLAEPELRKAHGEKARRFVMEKSREVQAASNGSTNNGKKPPFQAAGINDGKGVMFVSHNGEIFPSGFMPIPSGQYPHENVVEVYQDSPLFQDLRNANRLEGKCRQCEYRTICGGSRARAYALTGNPFAEEVDCAYIPSSLDAKERARTPRQGLLDHR